MPTLISKATGNLTASTTWALVDATSKLDSEAGNTALTTAYVYSSAFTPGAITVDGIAVKLAARVASPTGTISVCLYDSTTSTTIKEVTINVSDLPTCSTTDNEGGWIFFKFDASVTLSATDSYKVGAKCSVASEATLYRDATAGNWSRMLRTTTTQAPAAGDQLDIMGEHTGAGTGNDFTITMDNTATTDFGPGTDGGTAMVVCKRATLNYAYAAATNYYLKLSGNLIVYNGGTLTIGTTTNPIPRDSTAVLEFDPVADGGMGLIVRNGGTFTAQGLSRTLGKNVVSCKLSADAAAGATTLTVDTDTGWLQNNTIVVAPPNGYELRTLSANAGVSSLTITAGLTNAHSGTSPTQAEIILLTRNVKIRSASSTIMTYCNFKLTATIDIDWTEFYYMGTSATSKYGVVIETTTGSCNIQYSSFHDFEPYSSGNYITGTTANNITISNNVYYYIQAYDANGGISINSATSGTNIVISNNIIVNCGTTTASAGINLYDIGITVTNNTCAGGYNGIKFQESNAAIGTFSNNTVHNVTYYGLYIISGFVNSTLSSLTIWRCGNYGIYFNTTCKNSIFSSLTLFGNTTASIYFSTSQYYLTFDSLSSSGDTSAPSTNGILTASNLFLKDIYLFNADFSTVAGIKTAHTNDINIGSGTSANFILNNCKLGATNEVVGNSGFYFSKQNIDYVKSTKHDQTAGLHKSWFKYGIIQTDTTIFRTASPSARLTPNNASNKLESGSFKVNVNSGQTCTPSVYVRESVAGDGTDYNGNRARLILKRNDAIGITSDTVIATATANSEGAFELLTGTTPAATDNGVMEFVIDCDGTTGWINIDDFSATVS